MAKTKGLISFAVTAKLICVFVSHIQKTGFLMTRLNYNSLQSLSIFCSCAGLFVSDLYTTNLKFLIFDVITFELENVMPTKDEDGKAKSADYDLTDPLGTVLFLFALFA